MFILAQIIGIVAAIFYIAAMYMKDKKNILKVMLLGSICFSINAFLLGGITGGIINLVGAIQVFINYMYDEKEKAYPKLLVVLYIVIALISGMVTYKSLIDVFPIIASLLFSISILQTKEKNIRINMLMTFILWTVYSLSIKAYTTAIMDGIQSIMTIIAIVKNDIISKDKISCEE